ncbi:MAG TPA: hypothetical protein ENG63_10120 [Candidatus Desulfofervidus auxilii]|uniref:Uncharacterized protein n=1 Tax=Desulfofervidus auxilii TaxID=1621989 RepID=A0A7C0Y5Q1_DESA2|nr:hypothetical protein [Candidatus Desulfofervidus auxilii]
MKNILTILIIAIGAICLWETLKSRGVLGALPRQAINDEIWEWTDWRGQKRQIRVKRIVTY